MAHIGLVLRTTYICICSARQFAVPCFHGCGNRLGFKIKCLYCQNAMFDDDLLWRY